MKLVLLLAVFVILVGCVSSSPEATPTPEPPQATMTLADIAKHDSPEDCWLVINGKVHNVSTFIQSHPGGQAILQGCGTDATELFETRPMGSGTAHSDNARNLLNDYYIGDLA